LPKRGVAMLAIDTNVIVRFLTGDDPRQSAKAKTVIEGETVFVATTVLLETQWVLRSSYDFSSEAVTAILRAFAGLPSVTLQDAPLAAQALDWTDQGMDFADALHLAAAADCDAFVSFDARLAKTAKGLDAVRVHGP